MYKILLDEGLPLGAAPILRRHGIDAVHTEEVNLASANDHVILRRAREHGRACVTLDHDFHKLLAAGQELTPSVILLRFEALRAEAAASLILKILDKVGDDLPSGVAVTVTRRGIRLRKLPLQGSR